MVYASVSGAETAVEVEPLAPSFRPPGGRRIVTGISSYSHPGPYLVPAGGTGPVKWLARGPLAHTLREARGRGWEEAILEDARGRAVEGTRSNLLVVNAGRLIAPGPESYALPGVTRGVVLEQARKLGVPVEERTPTRSELRTASEVMLTSSLLEIASVGRVQGRWRSPSPPTMPLANQFRQGYARRIEG